ncbi:M48 family metallopeptidase [Campylobacter vulpis]|uniref:M48 family metallopeptidase n=1 Tax=Campylobacter vulpis TaxID=1655500 RepID=UPI001BCABC98|nr:SprT family zinc-dependent metalloprotease [Campylobacter vulpis]MBS4406041.1 M48 family metallopeptidase [Campylobacter vulpis]
MARQSTRIIWRHFEIYIFKKAVKNLILRIDNEGKFKLSVPYFYPLEKLEEFLIKNEKWLQNAYENYQKTLKKQDELIFLGHKFKVILEPNLSKARLFKNEIKTPNLEHLQIFIRKNARIIFNFYLKKWQRKTGLRVKRISLKTMQTRWGSCNHQKAYINLNLKLMQKPIKAIEYVILHEIAHLKFPHHGKEFYAFLLENMPDFKQRENTYFKNLP